MNRSAVAATAERRSLGGVRRAATPLDRVLLALAAAAVVATALSFLGRAAWLFELITHFRVQMAAAALLLLAILVIRRRPVAALLAALACATNGVLVLPWALEAGAGPAAVAADAAVSPRPLRLMAANVSYRNFDYAALLEQVRAVDPDVLGLLEVDEEWLDGLAALDSTFGWTVKRPQEGAYGLALYSKLPLTELEGSPYVEAGQSTAVLVELSSGDRPIRLVLAHVAAPVTPALASRRNLQFARLAARLREGGAGEQILLGDLNTTPWSPHYADLAADSGLRNAARGFGWLPTWPTGFPVLGIPIDHCLVSDGLQVLSFRTGADFGSDHLPIVIELAAAGTAAGT